MATRMDNSDTYSIIDYGDERYGNLEDEKTLKNSADEDATMYFGSFSRAAEEGIRSLTNFVSVQQEGWTGAADQGSLYDQPQNSLLLTLPTFDEMRNVLQWNASNINPTDNATRTNAAEPYAEPSLPEFEDEQDVSTLGSPSQLREGQQQQPQYRPRAPPSPHGSRASNDKRQGVGSSKKSSGSYKNPPARGKSQTRNASRGRPSVRGKSVSRTRKRSKPRGKSMERKQVGGAGGSRSLSLDSGPRGRSLSTPRQNARNNNNNRGRSRTKGPPNRKAGPSKGRKGQGNTMTTTTKNKNSNAGGFLQRSLSIVRKPQRNVRNAPPAKEARRLVKKPVRKQLPKQQARHHNKDDDSKVSSGRVSSAMDAIWRRVKSSAKKGNDKKGRPTIVKQQPMKNKQRTRPPTNNNGPTKVVAVKKNPARIQNQAGPQKRNVVKRQEQDSRKSRESKESREPRRRASATAARQRAHVEEREAPEPSIPEQLVPKQQGNESQWLGAITDSFVTPWSLKKKESNMADFENDRLGEDDAKSVRRQRLESAHEVVQETNFLPVQSHDLDSLTNSVSFELTTIGSETEGSKSLNWGPLMRREYLNQNGRLNSAWTEVAESAAVIARYVEDPEGHDSVVSVDEKEFRQAVTTFREHARRLNIGEKRLYATVRDDPSILEASTYDNQTLDEMWLNVGRTIDQRIDSYVDAFEDVFNRVQTFNDAHSCAPISIKDDRRRGRANE
jgi:hypothetical protein